MSGIYFAKVVAGTAASHIVFVVRHDASTSDILFQTSDTSGTDGANGVYRYGASGFPNSSYASSNYWVDVVFTTDRDSKPPASTRFGGIG